MSDKLYLLYDQLRKKESLNDNELRYVELYTKGKERLLNMSIKDEVDLMFKMSEIEIQKDELSLYLHLLENMNI